MVTESDKKIQEIQILEQNLQNILIQKQSFEIELNENKNALNELENSEEEVYKIIGQLMIKTEKNKIKEELLTKEKLLTLRINTFDKQEKILTDRIESLRKGFMSK